MSSIATAPKRTADQDPPDTQELYLEPEAEMPPSQQEIAQVEPSVSSTQTIGEVDRVERLLSQLEARSLALVPYANFRPAPARKTNGQLLLAGGLVAVWLSTLVLGVAYIRSINHATSGPERAALSTPLVIPTAESDPQEQKVANSVDHLAQALVSSSERMNELQAAMDRSNRDLQRIATKVNGEKGSEPAKGISVTAMSDVADATPSAPAPKLPNNWHRVLDLKPTNAATAHRSADGSVDYWLVQRAADQPPAKVLPIGTTADGVVIHNLDDGKDYTLTPGGEWRNGAVVPPGN
jgi:hypothetical protein